MHRVPDSGLDESREIIEALTRVAAELEYATSTTVNVDTGARMEEGDLTGD